MFLYGFELEGFFQVEGEVSLPPKNYPTDGFPGLVELRTQGGLALHRAYSEIIRLNIDTPDVTFSLHEHVFLRNQRGELRRRHTEKTAWDIQNLYGRHPRMLGNKTIASLQLNISKQLRSSYTDVDGKFHPETYGMLDIPRIVRSLDKEFAIEIKAASRQPGEYAVKNDVRLEYRSLPNSVFSFEAETSRSFLKRIKTAVEQ